MQKAIRLRWRAINHCRTIPRDLWAELFTIFYAQFDWPLPGDPLWISEDLTVRHDLVHILANMTFP